MSVVKVAVISLVDLKGVGIAPILDSLLVGSSFALKTKNNVVKKAAED